MYEIRMMLDLGIVMADKPPDRDRETAVTAVKVLQ
jgi:hypothetical protein